jgi:hypothetical protein
MASCGETLEVACLHNAALRRPGSRAESSRPPWETVPHKHSADLIISHCEVDCKLSLCAFFSHFSLNRLVISLRRPIRGISTFRQADKRRRRHFKHLHAPAGGLHHKFKGLFHSERVFTVKNLPKRFVDVRRNRNRTAVSHHVHASTAIPEKDRINGLRATSRGEVARIRFNFARIA